MPCARGVGECTVKSATVFKHSTLYTCSIFMTSVGLQSANSARACHAEI